MSKIVNEFLLAAENFMPELHLRQSEFTDSTSGQFIKHLERIQKLKKTHTQKNRQFKPYL